MSGGSSVSCTKLETVITKDMILTFLNDLYDVVEADEAIQAQFNIYLNPLFGGIPMNPNPNFNQFLREFRTMIRDFERDYEGEITLTYFIGNRDRLLRMDIDADMELSGERGDLRATFDFGASADDRWVLDMTGTRSRMGLSGARERDRE
jgi:hypothetical protein